MVQIIPATKQVGELSVRFGLFERSTFRYAGEMLSLRAESVECDAGEPERVSPFYQSGIKHFPFAGTAGYLSVLISRYSLYCTRLCLPYGTAFGGANRPFDRLFSLSVSGSRFLPRVRKDSRPLSPSVSPLRGETFSVCSVQRGRKDDSRAIVPAVWHGIWRRESSFRTTPFTLSFSFTPIISHCG